MIEKCDLCGKSNLKKIKNDRGQTFYYCLDDMDITSAEGKWLMPNGMIYNGVVKEIDNPDNAYLTNACPYCDKWYNVSSADNWQHCNDCYE